MTFHDESDKGTGSVRQMLGKSWTKCNWDSGNDRQVFGKEMNGILGSGQIKNLRQVKRKTLENAHRFL
jgi:hypothetical protein